MLAFEPPDWRALLGAEGEQTLGGVIACNLAGSRRVRAGSARDYILGFSAVNGFGEIWKAGGKVVKNVTGYDMCKLQAGAYGTLSALTELTLKVMPKPETACTIVLHGLADDVAIPTLANALNSPFEVSGAAHLPASAARRSKVERGGGGARRRDGYAAGRPAAVGRLSDRRPRSPGRARRASQRGGDGGLLVRGRRRSAVARTRIPHRLAALSDAKPGANGRPFDSAPRWRRRNFTSIGAEG